jgi:hypothetical protein
MHRRRFLEAGLTTVGASLGLGLASGQAETAFEPVGSVDIAGATEAVPHHDEEVVYVAVGDGVATVDIADGSPEVVAENRGIEAPGGLLMRGLWDLWPWEDRLIVAGPAVEGFSAGSGFALFDISDPADPSLRSVYETEFAIHNASFDDGVVYLTGSSLTDQPLVIVDASDDDPQEVGRFSIVDLDPDFADVPPVLRDFHDVHVQDGVAYMAQWDAGTLLVDVGDPGDPDLLARVGQYTKSELRDIRQGDALRELYTPPGNAHVTAVDEDATLLAVGAEAWALESEGTREGGAGGVDLYDIRDETDPRHLATIEPPESYGQTRSEWFTTAHNFDIDGDRLYSSWYFGGVKIHDISNPANPEEIAWWRQPEEASFWCARSAGGYVVASSANIQSKLGDGPNTTRDALYLFPDEAGSQPNPPSLTDPSGSGDDGASGADSGGEQQNGENGADDSGPGFGVGAAALGAAGAGYALAQRRRDEN